MGAKDALLPLMVVMSGGCSEAKQSLSPELETVSPAPGAVAGSENFRKAVLVELFTSQG